MSHGNNIERFREARGWSRPDLAKRMGTSPQQVERLEKGQRKLSQDWMEKAAAAFGVATEAIIMRDAATPEQQPTRSSSEGETVTVTSHDLSLSMGKGTIIDDWQERDPVQFDMGWLRSITGAPFDRLRLVWGIGTSMEPKFYANDRFLIDTTDRALSKYDGYYWISIEGAHALKRLRPAGRGRVRVISEAPGHEPEDYDLNEVRIEGRAVWVARGL